MYAVSLDRVQAEKAARAADAEIASANTTSQGKEQAISCFLASSTGDAAVALDLSSMLMISPGSNFYYMAKLFLRKYSVIHDW